MMGAKNVAIDGAVSKVSSLQIRGLARRQMRPGNCGHRRVFAIASPEHLHTPCRKNSTTHTSPGPTDSASSIAKATYILSASALTAYLSVNAERVASNGSARSQGPLENPGSSPFLIGVCGGTASGKTSVCKRIIELLKADRELEHQGVVNISQDCFYKDLTAEQADNISDYNFDHPDAFDFSEIYSSLQALKDGNPVHIPHYDFVTSSRLPETTFIASADVILFDGIMAFHQKEVRDLFDLKIFVDTDADVRLARRIRRDIVERGRDIIQVLDQYEKTVKPSFESFILPTKKYADIIVPRGAENTAAIDLIHKHVHMQLLARQQA